MPIGSDKPEIPDSVAEAQRDLVANAAVDPKELLAQDAVLIPELEEEDVPSTEDETP